MVLDNEPESAAFLSTVVDSLVFLDKDSPVSAFIDVGRNSHTVRK